MIGNIIIGVVGYGAAVFFALFAVWAIVAEPAPEYANLKCGTIATLSPALAVLAFAGTTKWMTGL